MLKNYFKIAIRNLLRNKVFSVINISGLTIGVICFILICLFIQDELSYDKYHSKADRIFRVIEHIDPVEKSASLPFPVAEALKTDFPNYIEEYVRFFNLQAATLSIEYNSDSGTKIQFNEPRVFFTDSTLFKIFDFKLKAGNSNEALNKPFSVLLTESTAKRYFGTEDPLGKTLSFEGETDLTVTGILEDTPQNSHFKFDILISFSSLNKILETGIPTVWYQNPCWTYIQLKEGVHSESLSSLLPGFVTARYPPARAANTSMYIQPLTSIHLNSKLDYEIAPNSDIKLVYVFGVIALLILFIAGVNFVNLSTARSFKRAKEVGIRKVIGAERKQLVWQFLSESLIITTVAVIIAVPLIDMLIPVLNNIAGKEITSSFLSQGIFWTSVVVFILLTGLLSGIYPAFLLSSVQPVKIISGKITKTREGVLLRKLLVTAQFSVSGILIIGTIVVYNQLNCLNEANLGFNKEEVIVLPIDRSPVVKDFYTFKDRIMQQEGIKNAAMTNLVIGTESQSSRYSFAGSDEEEMPLNTYWISADFGKTLGMTFLAGRDLSTSFPTDTAYGGGGVLVNESFVKFAGWDINNTVGKKIKARADGEIEIKGVVKDFHFTSLKQPIAPLVMVLRPIPQKRWAYSKFIYIRVESKELNNILPFLKEKYKEFDPDRAFSFSFLDERINMLYTAENSLVKVAAIFSVMAIFVACLGLYGLSSFTVEQKTKEIGIRKVIGASTRQVVAILSGDFLKLVAVSFIIASPLAWFIMNRWLEDFVYRTEISWWIFAVSGFLVLFIVVVTISYQTIKAATANPVKSLKYE